MIAETTTTAPDPVIPAHTTWTIDPSHSEIAFKVKHLMIANVKGVFRDFEASIQTEDDDFNKAHIEFSMNLASIDTGDAKRDQHLRSSDFFNVDTNPRLRFVSDNLQKAGGENRYSLSGDLEINSIKKHVDLDVEFGGIATDPWGQEKAGFVVSGKLNRRDWGLNWNTALEAGGMLLSDDVYIDCEVELSRKK